MPFRIAPKKERRPNGIYWVVCLGRKFTGTSRQRRYLRNRKDAKAFVVRTQEAHVKLGYEAFVPPLDLRAQAFICRQQLKPLTSTLTQAVDFFIRNRPRATSVKLLEQLAE